MDSFQSWENTIVNLAIRHAVSGAIPLDYVPGPVGRSCTRGSHQPTLWFVGLNYREDRRGAPGAIPAILQVWCQEGADSSPILLQQFATDNAIIQEVGCVQIDQSEIMYVITEVFNLNGTLVCFRINSDLHVSILSETKFNQLVWYMNLEPWGPTFVNFYALPWADTYGDWRREVVHFITYSQDGFFTNYEISLGDLLKQEERAHILNADDFRLVLSYILDMTDAWHSEIVEYPAFDNLQGPEEHFNVDGSMYLSDAYPYFVWHEVPLDNEGLVDE